MLQIVFHKIWVADVTEPDGFDDIAKNNIIGLIYIFIHRAYRKFIYLLINCHANV